MANYTVSIPQVARTKPWIGGIFDKSKVVSSELVASALPNMYGRSGQHNKLTITN